tara:strand:+ start:192 stop:407 length:216 start_codon:yes stop_codon:yes gene_type:complete
MPEQQTIKLSIRQDGAVSIDVNGVKSGNCIEITKKLEETLGILNTRQFKPEFYQNRNVTLQHNTNENQEQA